MKTDGAVKNTTAAPLLVLCVYLLLILSRFVDASSMAAHEYVYLSVVVLQILIFLIPGAIFVKLRGDGYMKRLRLRPFGLESVLYIAAAAVALIIGAMFIRLFMNRFTVIPDQFTLYDTYTAAFDGTVSNVLYVVLAFALLPAVCEEFIFRSVLLCEYEGNGIFCAVAVSSLLFAMLHFNLAQFPIYLFAGIILALVTYATRSALGAMLLHFLFNLFSLYGQPYLTSFYRNTGSEELFVFIFGIIFIVALFVMASEAGRLYSGYAYDNLPSEYRQPRKKGGAFTAFFEAAFSPAFLLCVAFYVILTVGLNGN